MPNTLIFIGSNDAFIRKLNSGWFHIKMNNECWAQIPPGFIAPIIPDEYIFHPEWNRDRINTAWKEYCHD